jgi:hypothetical protein
MIAIIFTISIPFMNSAVMGTKGINGAMRLMQEACADARALAILKQAMATLTISADGTINVQEGGGSGKRERLESLDVAGHEWRMEDRPPASSGSGGGLRGGRVEMKHKYPVKLPEGVTIEPYVNGNDLAVEDKAEVHFYRDGHCDDFWAKLMHPESGQARLIWLEVTTGLSDFETDPTKFAERFKRH